MKAAILYVGEASSEWLQIRAANLQPAGSCKLSCSEKLAENARAFLVANRKAATASQLFFFIANAWETSCCSRGSTNVTCECSASVFLLHVQVVIPQILKLEEFRRFLEQCLEAKLSHTFPFSESELASQ